MLPDQAPYAIEEHTLTAGEAVDVGVSFARRLRPGELLTAESVAPTAECDGATLGAPTINSEAFVAQGGATVAAGLCVVVKVSGLTPGWHTLKVRAKTTLGNTREVWCRLFGNG